MSFFFFNDTATTEIYTLSLHDALPISSPIGSYLSMPWALFWPSSFRSPAWSCTGGLRKRDRKSTRLNSSHGYISYAVFCLKKKKKKINSADASRVLLIHSRASAAVVIV